MGHEERRNAAQVGRVLEMVRGKEGDTPRQFNATGGLCEMCGSPQQDHYFCRGNGGDEPRIGGCEIDGDHLHRVCGLCHYPWVERTRKQLVEMIEDKRFEAQSEAICAFVAAIAERGDTGITIDVNIIEAMKGSVLTWKCEREGALTFRVEPKPATAT